MAEQLTFADATHQRTRSIRTLGDSPSPDSDRVETMVLYLERGPRWVGADEFATIFGWSDRTCRSIAAESGGRVLSGNAGYKLTLYATAPEFDEANGRLRSQARKMLRRVVRQQRVYHRRDSKT